MEKIFNLKAKGTTVRKEVIGGLTTFFAMAYILFVNPNMLAATGMSYQSIFVATALSAAIGTILTAILANAPFAQAPGMGLNAFFTYTVCLGMGYSWQQALAIVFISGVIFLCIAVSPLRGKIIAALPACLKAAIGAGIGLFITIIGCLNATLITASDNLLSLQLSVNGAFNMNAILAIIGVLVIGILMVWKVKGSIFIGIIITTLIGIPMGVTVIPETFTNNALELSTFFQLDFGGLLSNGVLPLITAIVSFLVVDMFDTVGTLIGTAGNAGMLDEEGNLPGGDRAIIADSIATVAGACLGTSTVTTFVESSAGISEGARTGLSSAVVGILFLASLALAPVAGIVPSAATAPALIIVGCLMMKSVIRIDWNDMEQAIPSFLTIGMMPFAYSISDGIGFGIIAYTILKLVRGKAKDVNPLMYVLALVFLAMYILKNI